MDKLDKMLYCELKREEAPSEFRSVIQNCLKDKNLNNKTKHYSLIKIVTASCASLLLTAGIVYAGTATIEKIWKQPKKIVGYVEENIITEEERKNAMSEKEAKKKAKEILKKFGYEGEKIISAELEKYAVDDQLKWNIETDNKISISFDANGGEELSIFFDSIFDKDIQKYRTTKEEAEKTARELCKKYGYDLSEYTYVDIDSNVTSISANGEEQIEGEAFIWRVNFYKQYDNLVDKYSMISIDFIPEINEPYFFFVRDEKYENNSVEVTEEQAKETALKEEQKTGIKYEVKNVEAELSIASMNGNAYARTIDYKQYCEERNTPNYPIEKQIEYRTDKHIRKVWKIRIEYDIPVLEMFKENFNHHDKGYIYYVDATTGEIIGGKEYDKSIMTRYENGELVIVN